MTVKLKEVASMSIAWTIVPMAIVFVVLLVWGFYGIHLASGVASLIITLIAALYWFYIYLHRYTYTRERFAFAALSVISSLVLILLISSITYSTPWHILITLYNLIKQKNVSVPEPGILDYLFLFT